MQQACAPLRGSCRLATSKQRAGTHGQTCPNASFKSKCPNLWMLGIQWVQNEHMRQSNPLGCSPGQRCALCVHLSAQHASWTSVASNLWRFPLDEKSSLSLHMLHRKPVTLHNACASFSQLDNLPNQPHGSTTFLRALPATCPRHSECLSTQFRSPSAEKDTSPATIATMPRQINSWYKKHGL